MQKRLLHKNTMPYDGTEAGINNNNLPMHRGNIDKHLLILEPICTSLGSGSGGDLLPWKRFNKTPH